MPRATIPLSHSSAISRRNVVLGVVRAVNNGAVARAAPNEWAPTDLGRELLRRLPAYVDIVCAQCDVSDLTLAREIQKKSDEAHERLEEVSNAILTRPVTELGHLTDLAIVQCFWDENEDDSESVADIAATRALVSAILDLSGVSRCECSFNALYERAERFHDQHLDRKGAAA